MRNLLLSNWKYKLLSILLAFGLWLFVGLQNPDQQMNYRDIPIRYSSDGSTTNAAGLTVISAKTMEAEVVASGKRNLLTSFSSSQIKAWVDISEIKTPGTYSLNLQVTMPVSDLFIDRITPSKLNLRLDRIVTRDVPVKLYVENNLGDGYIIENQQVKPETISITGPQADVGSVAEARVTVKASENGYSSDAAPYTFVSSSGETVDRTFIKADIEKVTVNVPVKGKKSIPLKASFTGKLAGWGDSEIPYTVSPAAIEVYGDADVIKNIDSIVAGVIDLNKVRESGTYEFELSLPQGLTNTYGVQKAAVALDLSSLHSKTVELTNFEFKNLPVGYAAISTKSISVRIQGRKEDLDKVTGANLKGVVDFQGGSPAYGEYKMPCTVSVFDAGNAAASGDYEATVKLVKAQGS